MVAEEKIGLFKRFRHLIWLSLRRASWLLVKGYSVFVYWLWGIEGVNRILYQCNSAHTVALLVSYGAVVGSGHDMNSPLLIHNAMGTYSNLTIGQECHLGKEVFLDLRDKIIIEDRVTISMRVTILTHMDVGHSPLGESAFPPCQAPVVIKRGAYIGASTTILQGVTIGACAVVGAGAVVIEDVPAYGISIGVPAQVIRLINAENTISNLNAPT
jgi:acetyltransferase-like isoleucine patch superfamily enzyme